MSESERIPLAEAEGLALEMVDLLRPVTERIEIAGSIRRRKETIGDIEIVCIPKMGEGPANLLGEPSSINLLDVLVDSLIVGGLLAERADRNGRTANGERHKRLTYRGFGVDLFCVLPPAQWAVIFAIRTGPAAFSQRLVTRRNLGGLLPEWAVVKDGAVYHRRTGELLPTADEDDLFKLVRIHYLAPEARA